MVHLNINSVLSNFNQFISLFETKLDVLVHIKNKIGSYSPTQHFSLNSSSKTYRVDKKQFLFRFMKIKRKELAKRVWFFYDIEDKFIEINFIKLNTSLWKVSTPPSSQNNNIFLDCVSKTIDKYFKCYEKFILVGDFHMEVSEPYLSRFLKTYSAKSIAKDKTCFKDKTSPSCFDLFVTKNPLSFHNTCTIATVSSDFPKMDFIASKMSFQRYSLGAITYRN